MLLNKNKKGEKMNTLVENKTHEILDDLISKDFMFTAFDITSLVRQSLGKHINVLHNDVKQIVHDKFYNTHMNGFNMLNYDRTVITIGSNPCLLYHTRKSDFSLYNPSWLEDDPNQDKMKSNGIGDDYTPNTLNIDDSDNGSNVADTDVDPHYDEVKKVVVNKDNRINIPRDLIVKAKMEPGLPVGVSIENGKIFIFKDIDQSVSYDQLLWVNADGRIRIGKKFLSEIQLNNAALNVVYENGYISVYA